jgi:hypothetical protein
METLILDRLQAALDGFNRIALADTVTPIDYPSWPAAYIYDWAEESEHQPTRTGQRQILDERVAIQIADRRDGIQASRSAVKAALIGWTPDGYLGPLYFHSARILQLSDDHALWLDLYGAPRALVIEP